MANLDIVENTLSLGQVKRITSDGTLSFVEMLVGDKTKMQMYYDKDKKVVQMEVKDTDLSIASLSCSVDANTLKDLILAEKDLYNVLVSETTNV